jgi:large subunit ribosomal protein L25
MAVIQLPADQRQSLGKGGARKTRAAGSIPAILYGHGETPVPLNIGARTFELALRHHKGGNAIVNLAVNGSEYTALVRAVQYDPVTHHILHLDFQHISLTEKIEVEVAVHLTGLPIGVKDSGGILEHITRHIRVRCLPTAIPSSVDVDVSALNIGDSVHVSDLPIGDLELLTDADVTVATVVPPSVIEEPVAADAAVAAAAEGGAAEPEVITKGKKEEGAAAEEKEKK